MKPLEHTVDLSSVLRRLLCDHQILCSVDCCKAQAFQFGGASMARWLAFERTDRTREIAEEIGRVRAEIRDAAGRIRLAASGLESEWDAAEFREFWDRFDAAYVAAASAVEIGDGPGAELQV